MDWGAKSISLGMKSSVTAWYPHFKLFFCSAFSCCFVPNFRTASRKALSNVNNVNRKTSGDKPYQAAHHAPQHQAAPLPYQVPFPGNVGNVVAPPLPSVPPPINNPMRVAFGRFVGNDYQG